MALVDTALEFCKRYHDGQFRRRNGQPFWTHPVEVSRILDRYGYSDEVTQCLSLMHDLHEDTQCSIAEINETFGYEIANGVYVLSRNTIDDAIRSMAKSLVPCAVMNNNELYHLRLVFADARVQRVKVADSVHNSRDIALSSQPEIKAKEIEEFYIPFGLRVAPLMTLELAKNIRSYRLTLPD